jgi:predicted acylesterase/phospholipase RssA
MSGGGSRGSYQAGAVWGMYYASEDKTQFEYDVITGISAGTLNLAAIASFAKGDEVNMLQQLSDLWSHITQNNLYSQWAPAGMVTGIANRSGVLNTAPLEAYVKAFWDKHGASFKRMIVATSVDSNTGAVMNEMEDTSDPIKAIISSASIPFVFPSQVWADGRVAMDGGAAWSVNLVSAVHRCREIVDDDSLINLDIVTVHGGKKQEAWDNKGETASNWLRYEDIKEHYNSIADVYEFQQAFPKVNFRYYVEPTESIPGGLDIINVDNTTITWPLQVLGRKDGANAINAGKGEAFKAMNAMFEDLEKTGVHGLNFIQ